MLVFGIITLVKLTHPLNANILILVTKLGIVILVIPEPAKHPGEISNNKFGNVILDKLVHPENAYSPILLTELGIVILVKLLHP